MLLEGKVVVITGGAGLIGKEFGRAVVNQGGIAIIADIDYKTGESAVNEIKLGQDSKNVYFIKIDIV